MNPEIERANGMLSPEKAMELDRIQEDAANNALNFLDVKTPEDPFPLIAMATGIGKGRIIHKIIDRTVRKNPNAKVLVIAGTKLTLVDQTQTALHGYTLKANGTEHNWQESELADDLTDDTEDISKEKFESSYLYTTIDYKKRKDSPANVHIATIQTIQSEDKQEKINPEDYDLVIVDEAHNIGTRARVDTVKKFKNVVGFTATPFRHSGVLKEPEQYGFTIIESLTLPEAQEKDFLPPLIETAIPTDHLVDEIPTNLNGEIDYKKLEKLLKESDGLRPFIAGEVADRISNDESVKKTVIAVNFVWEAEELARLLKAKGISVGVAVNQRAAREIHSDEIPSLDSIERYKLPKNDPNGLQVLVSPYVASEGFDAPETEFLVWASPTDSSLRYTQFTGRLARRAPDKQFGHVLDFLYQTTQYKWSYNFGQWMKDTVVQLPDGTLFQGSKKQRERFVSGIENKIQTDPHERTPLLREMVEGSTPELQDEEFSLASRSIRENFFGDWKRTKPLIDLYIQEYPDKVSQRKNLARLLYVATDPEHLFHYMDEHGIQKRKDFAVDEVQEGESSLSADFLTKQFVGNYRNLNPLIEQYVEEFPEYVVQRRTGNSNIVNTVLNLEHFKHFMVEHGSKLRDDLPDSFHEGDLHLGFSSLREHFVGHHSKFKPFVDQYILDYPENIVQKRKQGVTVNAVLNKDHFRQYMADQGIELKENMPDGLHDGEFPLNAYTLQHSFMAGDKTLKPLLKMYQEEHPENVVLRRSGSGQVKAVTNAEHFTQYMIDHGVPLRREISIPQEGEFKLTNRSLVEVFIGDWKKFKPAVDQYSEQYPDKVSLRKSRKNMVLVAVDELHFKQFMLERGIKTRDELSK